MTKGIHPRLTIRDCMDLIQFQKLVKLSSKYEYVEHNGQRYSYKCYRVFASKRPTDGKILKCRTGSNPAKFGNTPDSCFIVNDDIKGMTCLPHLDKQWYVDLAVKRLKDKFGLVV
jgi:DNA polymerase